MKGVLVFKTIIQYEYSKINYNELIVLMNFLLCCFFVFINTINYEIQTSR